MKRLDLSLLFIVIFTLLIATQPAFAEEHVHHDVVIGLTVDQQITLIEDHALEHVELEYNSIMGIYYGGEACWIPGEGDLHIMEPYGDGTPPAGHYQFELVAVDMPASVIAFDAETVGQILNGSNYVLDEWNWEAAEGWHFHNHISWGLDSTMVSPGQTVTATFMLIDTTGQYSDSEVFEVSLTAVPEPATLALLGCGAVIAIRRKSKQG